MPKTRKQSGKAPKKEAQKPKTVSKAKPVPKAAEKHAPKPQQKKKSVLKHALHKEKTHKQEAPKRKVHHAIEKKTEHNSPEPKKENKAVKHEPKIAPPKAPEHREEIKIDASQLPKLKKPTVVHPGDSWKKVEAVLFASGRYLSEERIAELSGLPVTETKAALMQLQEKYDSEDTTLQLFNEGDTWKLNVNEEFTHVVKNIVSEAELPTPILETLALIAYKTPVLQAEIIDKRGTTAYEHIGILEQKGFVEREKHKSSFKLRLASKFFDYFDVKDESQIKDLFKDVKQPEVKNLSDFKQQEQEHEFEQKIVERLKKLEQSPQEKESNEDFLDDFEQRMSKVKGRIDETDSEMKEFRRTQTQSSDIETEKQVEQKKKVETKDDDDFSLPDVDEE